MEELIAQIAAEHGYPDGMVERSAAARAAATGVSVEDVLRQWAGGDAPAPAATAPAPAAEAAEVATPSPADEAAAPTEPPGPEVEVITPVAADGADLDSADAEADPVASGEPDHPESHAPEGSPAFAGFPAWLASAFIIIPLIAMTYLLLAPDGPACGTSGQLALDPVTGEAENCDGSPYGVEVFMAFEIGEEIYAARCAACHGEGGGGGAGQVLSGGAVLASFPEGQCEAHIEWIALGTAGWPEATYGALQKPVGGFGQMPAFEGTLSEQEIAAVSLYERVAFGGEALPVAEEGCGFNEDAELAAP